MPSVWVLNPSQYSRFWFSFLFFLMIKQQWGTTCGIYIRQSNLSKVLLEIKKFNKSEFSLKVTKYCLEIFLQDYVIDYRFYAASKHGKFPRSISSKQQKLLHHFFFSLGIFFPFWNAIFLLWLNILWCIHFLNVLNCSPFFFSNNIRQLCMIL